MMVKIKRTGLLLGVVTILFSVTTAMATNRGIGYWYLNDNQKIAYDLISDGVASGLSSIDIDSTVSITTNDLDIVCPMVYRDNPGYFWLGTFENNGITAFGAEIYSSSLVHTVQPIYNSAMSSEVYYAASNIIASIPASCSTEHQKAQYLHDALCNMISYETGYTSCKTSYGALINHRADCMGYSRAYEYLLQLCGINAWVVQGTAYKADTGSESHMWNLANLDGSWTYIDLTWDDTTPISYSYFCLSYSAMGQNHTPDGTYTGYLPGGVSLGTTSTAVATSPAAKEEVETKEVNSETDTSVSTATALDVSAKTNTATSSPTEIDVANQELQEEEGNLTISTASLVVCGSVGVLVAFIALLILKRRKGISEKKTELL